MEIVFFPDLDRPVACATNMFGRLLWMANRKPKKQDFDVAHAFGIAAEETGLHLSAGHEMSGGSITVADMRKKEVIDTIDTFIENRMYPNCIVPLPEWNHTMGH